MTFLTLISSFFITFVCLVVFIVIYNFCGKSGDRVYNICLKQPEGRDQVCFVHYCVPSTLPIHDLDSQLMNALMK